MVITTSSDWHIAATTDSTYVSMTLWGFCCFGVADSLHFIDVAAADRYVDHDIQCLISFNPSSSSIFVLIAQNNPL